MEIIPIYYYLICFLGSFLLSLGLTPLVRQFAIKTNRIAIPKDNRWHKKETALLGGIAIFTSFMMTWIIAVHGLDWSIYGKPYLPIILCAAAIFALGLADDVFNMVPQHKLVGQIIIASIVIILGFRLNWTDSKTINLFISIIWLVGITNAFNLLDNMDGLSAGIAFIAALFLFLIYFQSQPITTNTTSIMLMSALYAGAILGFLIYNFNPASIFMGDAGSLFLGFMLACMTGIHDTDPSIGLNPRDLLSIIAIPIMILFIPIVDTGFVSLMRKLFRRPISQGGRDHSSHRMVAIGFSERKAVLILYAFAAISAMIALMTRYLSVGTSLVMIALFLLLSVFFWVYLAKVKVYPEDSILSGNGPSVITPILIDITYRRRLFEVVLDLVLITIAYYTSYLLRFEGHLAGDFAIFIKSLPIVIGCQIFSLFIMGVYRGVWTSTSLSDLMNFFRAITLGTIMAVLILLFIYRFESFSRAVFVIYWFLMLIFIPLPRLFFRLLDEGIRRGTQKGKPTLIYGTGSGGQITMREIEANRDLGLSLVGFMDDNPRTHRTKIHRYPVLGGQEDLINIIRKNHIQEIIISFNKDSLFKKKIISKLCANLGLEVQVRRMKLIIH
ncbi:MAG: glycosyl transferase [Deltaproteobacteria bacterium]|nr:glycosyl transferase [Deltaproteobacteria bacterium]